MMVIIRNIVLVLQSEVPLHILILEVHCFNELIGRVKRAPHWAVQSIFRVIYIYVSVCMSSYARVRRRNYVAQNAHAQFWEV